MNTQTSNIFDLPFELVWEILASDLTIANSLSRVNKYLAEQMSKVLQSNQYWTLKLNPLLDTSAYPEKQPYDWRDFYVKCRQCIYGALGIPRASQACLTGSLPNITVEMIVDIIKRHTEGVPRTHRIYSYVMKTCSALNKHGAPIVCPPNWKEEWISMIEILLTAERKLTGYLYYTKLLHWASSVGSIAIVKLLAPDIIYKDNPKRAWSRRDEAQRCGELMVNAAKNGHHDMVEWFIDSNQVQLSFDSASTSTSYGVLALKKAAQRGHVDTVKVLLSHVTDTVLGTNACTEFDYIFNKAAQSGYLQIVELLINVTVAGRYLVNPASENNYAIRGAVRNIHGDVVEFFTSV